LVPLDGNLIVVNGVACTIPDAGVGLSLTGLVSNNSYWVYAVATAGVITSLEASGTTGHSASTTPGNNGIQIKTGDDTRSLVGMVRTAAGPAFVDSATQRFVISWFNRSDIYLKSAQFDTGAGSIGSGFGDRTPSNHCEFLTWPTDAVSAQSQAMVRATAAGAIASRVTFDGSGGGDTLNADGAANIFLVVSVSYAQSLSEGYHYSTWFCSVQNGSGQGIVTNMAQIRG
jgi:hypothetical protein